MPRYTCKECGKNFTNENQKELVQKAHDHIHADHGKHVSMRKIRKQVKNGSE